MIQELTGQALRDHKYREYIRKGAFAEINNWTIEGRLLGL
jgi:hypothetical protein